MSISVITPTADRPLPFALCERWIARQTCPFDEWIVADGGAAPARCTTGQIHIHEPRPPGAANFAHNLLNALARSRGDVIVFIEDDDWYAPTHVESLVTALGRRDTLIAGGNPQHYYHVGSRLWRTMQTDNHSSLCQMAIRRGGEYVLREILEQCLLEHSFYVDILLWRAIGRAQWARTETTCIGIKGLPGQAGLGIGHRPAGAGWKADPELEQLRSWIGGDAEVYAGYGIASKSHAVMGAA